MIRFEERVSRQITHPVGAVLPEGSAYLRQLRFDWTDSIESLGTERFGEALIDDLSRLADVDSCVVVNLAGPRAAVLFGDSAFFERALVQTIAALPPTSVRAEPCMVRLDASSLGGLSRTLSSVFDGVLVHARRSGRAYALAFFRTADQGAFTESEVDNILSASGTCLSLVAKHELLLRAVRSADPLQALLADDVPQLEAKLRHYMPTLSESEMKVCARILRGMSTPGIAVDLNLRDGSVATYRKRAYRRLGIGTRLELIRMFMSACMSHARAGEAESKQLRPA